MANRDPALLKIGEVARRAGVRVDTVRFYEREGLLTAPVRAASGYRYFDPSAIARIAFVKQTQALGFSLVEAAAILRSLDRGGIDYAAGERRLVKALARLDDKLAELRAMRRHLVKMVTAFRRGRCDELELTARTLRRAPG